MTTVYNARDIFLRNSLSRYIRPSSVFTQDTAPWTNLFDNPGDPAVTYIDKQIDSGILNPNGESSIKFIPNNNIGDTVLHQIGPIYENVSQVSNLPIQSVIYVRNDNNTLDNGLNLRCVLNLTNTITTNSTFIDKIIKVKTKEVVAEHTSAYFSDTKIEILDIGNYWYKVTLISACNSLAYTGHKVGVLWSLIPYNNLDGSAWNANGYGRGLYLYAPQAYVGAYVNEVIGDQWISNQTQTTSRWNGHSWVTTSGVSKSFIVYADKAVFTFNGLDELSPNPQVITLTASKSSNVTDQVTWSTSPSVSLRQSATPGSNIVTTGDVVYMHGSDFGANTAVLITATAGELIFRLSAFKIKDGAAGQDGTGERGNVLTAASTGGTSWDSGIANAAVDALTGTTGNITGDVVTLYNNGENWSETRRWDGNAWVALGKLFGGDIIVDRTIGGQQLAFNAVGVNELADSAVGLTKFAAGIRPPRVVSGTLPTLPNANYPAGDTVVRTDDGVLYRSMGTAWTAEVNASLIASTLVAGQIGAGAIGADQLAAGAVTTGKLLVTGRGAAINDDPQCSDLSAWSTDNNYVTVETITDGKIGSTVLRATQGNHITSRFFALDPAKMYKVRCYARRVGATNGVFYLRIYQYDSAGTSLPIPYWEHPAANGITLTTSWAQYVSTFVPQATAVLGKLAVVANWTSATGSHEVQDLAIEEMVGADLIVDGSIAASKLTADFIYTKAININDKANVDSSGNAVFKSIKIQDSNGDTILESGGNLNYSRVTADSNWLNSNISINADGSLNNAGTGSVSISGLGFNNFRIVTWGSSDTVHVPLGISGGLYKNNSQILSAVRSYTVVVFNRSTSDYLTHETFDVYGSGANTSGRDCIAMANYLNALDSTKIIVVYGYDEPYTLRLEGGLAQAMYNCGASRVVYGSPEFKYRSAYVLIGIPDCGEGNGIEFYQGSITDSPTAYIDCSFSIYNGNIVGASGSFTPTSLRDYNFTGDYNSSSDLMLEYIYGSAYYAIIRGNSIDANTEATVTYKWNTLIASKEAYSGGVFFTVRPAKQNQSCMIGISTHKNTCPLYPSSDPSTNTFYVIDHAIYFAIDNTVYYYQNAYSTPWVLDAGPYTITDVYSLTFDGSCIRFWKNGSEIFVNNTSNGITAGVSIPYTNGQPHNLCISTYNGDLNADRAFIKDIKFGPLQTNTSFNLDLIASSSNVRIFNGNDAYRISGTNGTYGEYIKSKTGYTGGASLSFKVTGSRFGVGRTVLNESYYHIAALTNSPDAGWYTYNKFHLEVVADTGQINVYEDGVHFGNIGTCVVDDIITIQYTGTIVRYLKNATVLRQKTIHTEDLLFGLWYLWNIVSIVADAEFKSLYNEAVSGYNLKDSTGRTISDSQALGNLLKPEDWVLNQIGSQPGFPENSCSTNGYNIVGPSDLPGGHHGLVWRAHSGTAISNHSEGGWDSTTFKINHTKMYRFSVWIKAWNVISGLFYLGVGLDHVQNMRTYSDNNGQRAGETNGNPYFVAYGRGYLEAGKWYLLVGYVYPSSQAPDNTLSYQGGVYDGTTGRRLDNLEASSYRWVSGITQTYHRAYQFYTNGVGNYQDFWSPRVDLCDGSEPSLDELLAVGKISARNPINPGNAGLVVDNASITNALIGNFIGSSNFDSGLLTGISYEDGVLNNATVNTTLAQAGSFTGWAIDKQGNAAFGGSVVFGGTLAAASGTFGDLTVSTSGNLKSGSRTGPGSTEGAGFWLDSNNFAIGNSSKYFRWDGSSLTVNGDLINTPNVVSNAISNSYYNANLDYVSGENFSVGNYALGYNKQIASFTSYGGEALISVVISVRLEQVTDSINGIAYGTYIYLNGTPLPALLGYMPLFRLKTGASTWDKRLTFHIPMLRKFAAAGTWNSGSANTVTLTFNLSFYSESILGQTAASGWIAIDAPVTVTLLKV